MSLAGCRAAGAGAMCSQRLGPALPLFQVVREIQIGFIQAQGLEMGVIVGKDLPDLTWKVRVKHTPVADASHCTGAMFLCVF